MTAVIRSSLRLGAAALGLAALVTACEPPPNKTQQTGARGVGLVQFQDPDRLETLAAENQVPEPEPPLDPELIADSPKATEFYENVQVLTDLSIDEFNRLMIAMTKWVSPDPNNCYYCHVEDSWASDDIYTKTVSRRMLMMTRDINANWDAHVKDTGVTCYTCHRGRPVPKQIWYKQAAEELDGIVGNPPPWQAQADDVREFYQNEPFAKYILDDQSLSVLSNTALGSGEFSQWETADHVYVFMMAMSDSLGVNCTYCHNSRSLGSWDQSSQPRRTAWYGIRLNRAINAHWIDPLTPVFPPERKGPTGDPAYTNCGTCHLGLNKPLYGTSMLADYPSLAGPEPAEATSAPLESVTPWAAGGQRGLTKARMQGQDKDGSAGMP